jgi:hypothetical protein
MESISGLSLHHIQGHSVTDQSDAGEPLLRGGQQLAFAIYGSNSEENVRRFYNEADEWPVFKLKDGGPYYGLASRIQAHKIAKSAEKEAKIALAAAKAPPTLKSTKPRRRRARAA